jgi:transposase InsO family protein
VDRTAALPSRPNGASLPAFDNVAVELTENLDQGRDDNPGPAGLMAGTDPARRDLFAYTEGYYNRQRTHSVVGYITPEQADLKTA